jgi:hypothetical protein
MGRRSNEFLMATLLCFGFGYCAENFVAMFGAGFERVVGTVRGAERAAILNAYDGGSLQTLLFDGAHPTPEIKSAIVAADYVLVSVPPAEEGDPVIASCSEIFPDAKQ